jgi:hypothetical protein
MNIIKSYVIQLRNETKPLMSPLQRETEVYGNRQVQLDSRPQGWTNRQVGLPVAFDAIMRERDAEMNPIPSRPDDGLRPIMENALPDTEFEDRMKQMQAQRQHEVPAGSIDGRMDQRMQNNIEVQQPLVSRPWWEGPPRSFLKYTSRPTWKQTRSPRQCAIIP